MNETLTKTKRREIARESHINIYKSLVNYLIGPKWNNAKYQIGNIKCTLSTLGIIAISTGSFGCEISIYFHATKIRIHVSYKSKYGDEFLEADYVYVDFNEDCSNMPESMDDYTFRTKIFFQELLRHCSCVRSFFNTYKTVTIDKYIDCVPDIPENFPVNFGMVEAALYPYDGNDTETIDFMTEIFKSKRFKRYRGDNQ